MHTPPKIVVLASWLYVIPYVLGLGRVLVTKGGPASVGALVAWLLVVAYFCFVARSLYRGRNWARLWVWLLTVFAVFSPLFMFPATFWERALFVTQILIGLTVAVLLALPASASWFRPNNSFKPKPLRGSA